MSRGRREAGSDSGVVGARAHQPRIGPRSQCEAEAVQQDRLAGPGLTREHSQSRAERKVESLDQHDVANGESGEHAAAPAAAVQKIDCQARAKKPRSSGLRGGPGCCTRPLSNRSL